MHTYSQLPARPSHCAIFSPPAAPAIVSVAVNVLRHLINPLVSWVVVHDELEVLAPDVVQSLVADVFQNPEKGGQSEGMAGFDWRVCMHDCFLGCQLLLSSY